MDVVKDRINKFLLERGLNEDTVTKNKMKQLIKIDEAIQKKLAIQAMAKENKINTSTICEATGIARQTVYNNPLLQEYIKKYETVDRTKQHTDAVTKERDELKERVDKFVHQTFNMLEKETEISELEKELKNIKMKYDSLQTRYERLQIELNSLKKGGVSNLEDENTCKGFKIDNSMN